MAKKVTLFVVLVLALLVASVSPAQAAKKAPTNANIYVIHGINGVDLGTDMALPVDISIAGVGCALQSFSFQQVTGPVKLPAGAYDIAISLANPANPCSNAPVISGQFDFMAGKTYTVIAYLTAAGAPTAAQFENDVTLANRSTSRISLAHTAYAPVVDAYLARGEDTQVLQDVPNGASADLLVRPGKWSAWLTLPDSDARLFEAAFKAKPGRAYFNYVVGSAANGLYLVQFSVKMKYTR